MQNLLADLYCCLKSSFDDWIGVLLCFDAAQDALRVHYICARCAFGRFARVIKCIFGGLHSVGGACEFRERVVWPGGMRSLGVLELVVRFFGAACFGLRLALLLALLVLRLLLLLLPKSHTRTPRIR